MRVCVCVCVCVYACAWMWQWLELTLANFALIHSDSTSDSVCMSCVYVASSLLLPLAFTYQKPSLILIYSQTTSLVCRLQRLWQRIPSIDYVQRSSSSLYRRLRYRNCLNYITLHYITLKLQPLAAVFACATKTGEKQQGNNCSRKYVQ